MKRSGNHGLINWIKGQEEIKLYNNIVPINKFIVNNLDFPQGKTMKYWQQKIIKRQSQKHLKSLSFSHLVTELFEPSSNKLFSLEDHKLGYQPITDLPENSIKILILRDAKNLFSSRIKKANQLNIPESYPRIKNEHLERIIETWKEHAREFLGETSMLGSNTVKITFDRWYQDREYRESLSKLLGLKFSDQGFKEISGIGGGSSFDSTNYNGNPQNMKVLDRDKNLAQDELDLLNEIMSDPEVLRLNDRIFTKEI